MVNTYLIGVALVVILVIFAALFFLLPALLPSAAVPAGGGPANLERVGLGLFAPGGGGVRTPGSQSENVRDAVRLAAPNVSGLVRLVHHPSDGERWAPHPPVPSLRCAASGCLREQCQYAPPLCALCAWNNAMTAGGGGGPYGPTNRSAENDVLTTVSSLLALLGIQRVIATRDSYADGRTDLLFTLGRRSVSVDVQSHASPAHPLQGAPPPGFLTTMLRAAANGYEVTGILANFHGYFTMDGIAVGRAMGPGPNEIVKAFVRSYWVAWLVVQMLTDEDGRWQIVNLANAAAALEGDMVEIPLYMAFVNGSPMRDACLPAEAPAAPLATAAALAAAAAHAAAGTAFVAPSFQVPTDFTTGQAHTFSSMFHILSSMGTFQTSQLGAFALHPPAAPLPIAAPNVWLWDRAASGAPSANFAPFCTQMQAGAFPNNHVFPGEYSFVGRNYTDTRGLPRVFVYTEPIGATTPEFHALAFSRSRFAPPVRVQVHNPVMPGGAAVPAGGVLVEPSFF